MSHNISLTASAARHINALSQEAGHPVMLRVIVEGGGCSGFQYKLDLTEAACLKKAKSFSTAPRPWSMRFPHR